MTLSDNDHTTQPTDTATAPTSTVAPVRREFIVERQGRSFVLYAGLLDRAHAEGLSRIQTALIQIPSDDNGQMAIAHAVVTTSKGTFDGWGDAGPTNVTRAMLNCTIRLAETRAKARALRDATNIGVVAFEELDDANSANDSTDMGGGRPVELHPRPTTADRQPGQPSDVRSSTPYDDRTAPNGNAVPLLATPAQIRAIYSIGRDQHNLSEDEIDARSSNLYGVVPPELTRKQASDLITSLKGSDRR